MSRHEKIQKVQDRLPIAGVPVVAGAGVLTVKDMIWSRRNDIAVPKGRKEQTIVFMPHVHK